MAWSARKFFHGVKEIIGAMTASSHYSIAHMAKPSTAYQMTPPPATQPGDGIAYLLGPTAATNSTWVSNFGYAQIGHESGMRIQFLDGTCCFYPRGTEIYDYYAMLNASSRGGWVHQRLYKKVDYVIR